MSNKKQAAGDIEVEITKIYCLNPATPNLPFRPNQAQLVSKIQKTFFFHRCIELTSYSSQMKKLDFVIVIWIFVEMNFNIIFVYDH
jgi:hypothetical protein